MKLIYNRKPTKEEIDRLQEIRESKYFYYDNNNKKRLVMKMYPFDLDVYIEKFNVADSRYMWMPRHYSRRLSKKLRNYFNTNEVKLNPPLLMTTGIEPYDTTIGFDKKANKWYGWDYEDIREFSIGHIVKKGDIGYIPSNIEDLYNLLKRYKQNAQIIKHDEYISVKELLSVVEGITENDDYICHKYWSKSYNVYPGKGEWQAKTLDDCKEMAIDFVRAIRRKKYNELYI